MKNLHSFHSYKTLSIPTIFHHLRITATSPLIPRDKTMHVTVDQLAYSLTAPSASHQDIWNNIRLFLNPHNRLPYLLHTHGINEDTIRRLVITTTLPCKTSLSRDHSAVWWCAQSPTLPTALQHLHFPRRPLQTSYSLWLLLLISSSLCLISTLHNHGTLLATARHTNTRYSWCLPLSFSSAIIKSSLLSMVNRLPTHHSAPRPNLVSLANPDPPSSTTTQQTLATHLI